ncbi:MAG: DUF4326 domain-containing protein [Nitrospinae bacterium]|nr:DUF4326 domain-containing protein [Nitrospinota bacterium]
METTVVNLNDYVDEPGSGLLVRIDRRTKWGNPFRVGPDVIEKYRRWLWEKIRRQELDLHELADLQGCELGCHCRPLPCHGDVLARAAEWAARYLDEMPREVGRNERGYALPEFNHPLA